MKSYYRNHCKGQITIIVAISLIVLIGMVGLAIDSGRGYGVKAKLSAAVDAAAIAAGRALSEGATDGERLANAQIAAQKFFHENFPDNYLGATPTALNTDAVHNPDGYWQVNVSASADMPTYLMQVLSANNVTVAASGTVIRRDVDVMLVMDTSGSLGPPTSPADTLPRLKECAKTAFISKFIPTYDRLGLVSFASGAVLDVPINKNSTRGFNLTQMNNAINALTVTGSTASAEGMRRALNEINAIPATLRSSLRAIVFFSDGAPNDVPSTFTRTSGSPLTVTGDLYSETDPPATAQADRVYRSDQRDTQLGTYSNIPTLPNIGFMITGVGNIPLASYNNKRTLTGAPYTNSRCNVNKAARNMVENVANTARTQDIYTHTTALGNRVNSNEITFCGYDNKEYGANIMKRLANKGDSDTYNPSQPKGIYCPFVTMDDCSKCFSEIASEILRLI